MTSAATRYRNQFDPAARDLDHLYQVDAVRYDDNHRRPDHCAIQSRQDLADPDIDLVNDYRADQDSDEVIFRGRGMVVGLTVVHLELFLIRYEATEVEVYKLNNQNNQVKLSSYLSPSCPSPCASPEEVSQKLRGIAGCQYNSCLYLSTTGSNSTVVHRLDLSSSSALSWMLSGQCSSLSVTSNNHNILAVLVDTRRVLEYTTHGSLIREISLDPSIDNPRHCVKLSTGNFVVCHIGAKQHRVCIVDNRGRILKSYGQSKGSHAGQLNYPYQLSVDKTDKVFVVDNNNHEVQVLSRDMNHVGYMPSRRRERLRYPMCAYLNQVNGCLYVGDESGSVHIISTNYLYIVA